VKGSYGVVHGKVLCQDMCAGYNEVVSLRACLVQVANIAEVSALSYAQVRQAGAHVHVCPTRCSTLPLTAVI
jgi:hypothetical protein